MNAAEEAHGIVHRGVGGYMDIAEKLDCVPVRARGRAEGRKSGYQQAEDKHAIHLHGRHFTPYARTRRKVHAQASHLEHFRFGGLRSS
jgi:hypothetical protein